MNREKLTAALGLSADATDEEIIAAIGKLKSKSTPAAKEAARRKRSETVENAVSSLMVDKGLKYEEAWNEAKKQPEVKSAMADMRQPASSRAARR